MNTDNLITRAYNDYRDRLTCYISARVNDEETARDLVQDVFVRVLEYRGLIYEAAVENFLFTIARNIVNDWLRHHYVCREHDRYMADYQVATNDTESRVVAADLARRELTLVAGMPRQRARVYRLRRYLGLSARETAERLGMSPRTVENHWYAGTHSVRAALADCI